MKLEYTIASSWTEFGLVETVSRMILSGWRPHGGVAVSITENRHYGEQWAQAMVRDVEARS